MVVGGVKGSEQAGTQRMVSVCVSVTQGADTEPGTLTAPFVTWGLRTHHCGNATSADANLTVSFRQER